MTSAAVLARQTKEMKTRERWQSWDRHRRSSTCESRRLACNDRSRERVSGSEMRHSCIIWQPDTSGRSDWHVSLAIWLTHFGTRHLRGTDHRRVCDACV